MLCHICNKATAQISDSETTGDENFVRDMAACRFFLPSRFSRWPLQSMRQADPCAILPVESSKYRRTGSSASPAVWQGTCLFGRDLNGRVTASPGSSAAGTTPSLMTAHRKRLENGSGVATSAFDSLLGFYFFPTASSRPFKDIRRHAAVCAFSFLGVA
jgi:hypothetical protein